MRPLLDSHAIIWYVDQDHMLSATAHTAITDPANELLVSAATVWEIAIKCGLSKLTLSAPFLDWMKRVIANLRLDLLPITVESADRQSSLPRHHRDPFDRLLIAQCLCDNLPIVSADAAFDPYGVTRLW